MKLKFLNILSLVIGSILLFILSINLWIIGTTKDKIFENIEKVPHNRVGIVLGTSNKLISGDTNRYFYERIKVAAELFKANKIDDILVSGDNRTQYYNEPKMMKEALLAEGIPEKNIKMDVSGLRTLDSIIRGKLIFGQSSFTIITQPFHSYRALFIAQKHEIDAIAMVTKESVEGKDIKAKFREVFARTMAFWDLYVVNKMPGDMSK